MRFKFWRGLRVPLFLILITGVLTLPKMARAQGEAISTATKSGFLKSNQSKVFYHDGNWWAVAHHDSTSRWFVWKFKGGVWTRLNSLVKSSTMKYDAVVNSAGGKLYLIGSHASATEFRRYSYASGTATWTLDTGFPVSPSFNNEDASNPLSLVQAKNGDLWIFRIDSNKLQAKRSTNGGAAWSAAIEVKTGLTSATGTTDAVAFSSGGHDFVGVAYGETPAAGTKFGLLTHQDGAANETWTDESSSLTLFGAERGSNQLGMTTDASNNIFLFTKTGNASGSDPRNTLYKRANDGAWQKFKVNASAGEDWKSPAVVFEAVNNKIYVMGINAASQQGEYKTCSIGQEATLQAEPVSVLFSSAGATFAELSAPPGGTSVDISTGLMVAADNSAASDIWYRHLPIVSTAPVTIGAVVVNSNQVNANAAYTIPLMLSAGGGLVAGSGIINLIFPSNTLTPASLAANAILVDGTPCTNVTVDAAARHLTITTPVNLSHNQSFAIEISASAGLVNPTLAGLYQLNASTSSQPAVATSPDYEIVAATSAVTPATVSLSASEPDSCANYSIAFNLGVNGRMLPGVSTFALAFNAETKLAGGALSGVRVNGVAASATADGINKTVQITLPASVPLGNDAAVTLYLPASAICNPSTINDYTLTVATSVEATPGISNPYKIIGRVLLGPITLNPPYASSNAIYTIPLTLSSNGALAAGAGVLNFRFPAGTTVPSSITASHITVDGTPSTAVVSNSATREVMITTPVDLGSSQNFSVEFTLGAGIVNPSAAGDYALQAWTSSQPTPVASPIYTLLPSLGANPISALTKSGYKKSNQSKVFYHDTQWWAVAFDESVNRWYIWKFNGAAWIKAVGMDKGASFNYDVVVNASANTIYLFGAHKSLSKFRRYSYIGGAWKSDSGFPIGMSDFVSVDPNNPISLVQAQNGDLWIFRIRAGILQAKRSSDGGATWSGIIPVKSGLRTANGTTDAVAFKSGDNTYVGVGYGETDSLTSQFGFLLHQDGAADDAWTDESASLSSFGTERARNQISMTTDASNNVYLFTQNAGVAAGNPHNTLFRRRNTGIWAKFKVNSANAWKSPALAVDASGKALYLMGINTATAWGEYKACSFGQEATLDTMSAAGLFAVNGAKFDDLSAPAANVTAPSGLMLCADNLTANDIYFRYFELGGSTALNIGAVEVVSNQINANASYTIPLKLSNLGALEAGVGVLNFIFPPNTFVRNNMPASAVKVDGVPVPPGGIISNNQTRQVTVTTPVNLPDDHAFSVVFDSAAGAGLLNPTTVGAAYRLTAWTSAQPVQMKSPVYSLVQTTTTLTPATVAPFPTSPDSLADYTLKFKLGSHGRPIGGSGTIMVKFGAATNVSNGSIAGVKLNLKDAAATADSISRQVTVAIPVGVSLTNNSAVTLFIPKSKIRNPSLGGFYSLMAATSVETTFVASNEFEIKASNSIGAPISGTTKSFDRNNQSKVFHHGGFWWVAAQAQSDLKWYLWKFDGVTWTQNALIHTAGKSRPDCVLDAPANKVYIVLPGAGTTYITRLSYAPGAPTGVAGVWSIDSGYPVLIADFAQVSDRAVNLARAKNGHFWVFRATDSTLTAKRSGDLGLTWSPLITVKKKLHNGDGLTDATAFTLSSGSYIGVGYGENSAPGSIYGFLRHLDTDPDSVWTDETAAMPQFPGTTSDDHVSMITYSGEVLMLVKTNGGSASVVNVGLLRRATNGAWSLFPVLLSTGWTRPVMAIDQSNSRLYLFGTREGKIKVGEMKTCAIGDYGSLLAAKIDTVFKNETDNFFNASVPFQTVNSTTNLLICNGNESRDELWYNLIKLGPTAAGSAPKTADETTAAAEAVDEDFEGVQVFPNPFNPQTSFRFKVKENSPVKLQIFNLAGQLVRTIVDEDFGPGVYVRRWNGRNQDGRPAASGLYFYRLQIGQQMMNGRIQMLK
jgi:hypothetical protein